MKVADYSVRWRHNTFSKKEVEGQKVLIKKELKKKSTDCVIYDKAGEPLSYGVAKCNKEDKFSKLIGRKLSFSEAVKKIDDKVLRTQLWDQFKKENFKKENKDALKVKLLN